jgi:hypothetical protein
VEIIHKGRALAAANGTSGHASATNDGRRNRPGVPDLGWSEVRTMKTGTAVALKTSHDTSWRHFVRHYFEMVAAMIVGMAVLGATIRLIFALLGYSYSDMVDQTELRACVMATNMVVGMSLWMRHRGHGWTSIGEMAAAMYLPFIVLFVPFWSGLLSGGGVLGFGHVLMLAVMLVAMLHRRDEYTKHRRRYSRAPAP